MKRLLSVLTVAAIMISLTAGSALADRPRQESYSVVGDEFLCGDEVLTAISGSLVERFHEHALDSGRIRLILVAHLEDAVFEDASGNTYNAVGAFNQNFTFDPDVEEGSEIGRGIFNFNLIGARGWFGDERFRYRITRDGEGAFIDKGTCQLVE